jgi:pimeloyl-ACP methyl ester carboxylesterase
MERRLERVTCPTLIIWGENDRLIKPVYAQAFHKLIAGSKLVILEGTGHMPMFEKTAEWSAAITAFLAEDPHATPEAEPRDNNNSESLQQKDKP